MITFQKADLFNASHGAAILHLVSGYAEGLSGGGEGLPKATRENLISELGKRADCHVILGRDGEVPLGVAICFEGFSTFACKPLLNIHDFAISPDYQGRGLARTMLDEVEAMARDLGCCKITLEVLEGNKVARHVYEKYGFAAYELDPKMGKALFFDKKLD